MESKDDCATVGEIRTRFDPRTVEYVLKKLEFTPIVLMDHEQPKQERRKKKKSSKKTEDDIGGIIDVKIWPCTYESRVRASHAQQRRRGRTVSVEEIKRELPSISANEKEIKGMDVSYSVQYGLHLRNLTFVSAKLI